VQEFSAQVFYKIGMLLEELKHQPQRKLMKPLDILEEGNTSIGQESYDVGRAALVIVAHYRED
jgi:hypothetical protein